MSALKATLAPSGPEGLAPLSPRTLPDQAADAIVHAIAGGVLLPGERIVGIATRGKGVVFHTIHCEKLAEYEDQSSRWIDLRWTQGRNDPTNNVTIEVTMANDAGVLGRICTLIGEQNANIADLQFTERKPDFYRMTIEIQVRDVEHLHHVITAVEADSDVAHVKRTRQRLHGMQAEPQKAQTE